MDSDWIAFWHRLGHHVGCPASCPDAGAYHPTYDAASDWAVELLCSVGVTPEAAETPSVSAAQAYLIAAALEVPAIIR